MKKRRAPYLRGLTVQVLAITVLPLTLLLLLIAFGSVWLHQQDMRALVGERDERAVQSAAAALDFRTSSPCGEHLKFSCPCRIIPIPHSIHTTEDLASDFDGGLAYLDMDGQRHYEQFSSGLGDW